MLTVYYQKSIRLHWAPSSLLLLDYALEYQAKFIYDWFFHPWWFLKQGYAWLYCHLAPIVVRLCIRISGWINTWSIISYPYSFFFSWIFYIVLLNVCTFKQALLAILNNVVLSAKSYLETLIAFKTWQKPILTLYPISLVDVTTGSNSSNILALHYNDVIMSAIAS